MVSVLHSTYQPFEARITARVRHLKDLNYKFFKKIKFENVAFIELLLLNFYH